MKYKKVINYKNNNKGIILFLNVIYYLVLFSLKYINT